MPIAEYPKSLKSTEVELAYNSQVPLVTQAEAEGGLLTSVRRFTPERVKQAIISLAGGGAFDNYDFLKEEQAITNNSTLTTKLSLSFDAGKSYYVEGEIMFDNNGATNCGADIQSLFTNAVVSKYVTWQYTTSKTTWSDASNNTFLLGLQTYSTMSSISKFAGRIIFRGLIKTGSATVLEIKVAQNVTRSDETFYLRLGSHILSKEVV